jgi:hypothetical protein
MEPAGNGALVAKNPKILDSIENIMVLQPKVAPFEKQSRWRNRLGNRYTLAVPTRKDAST